MELHLKRIAKRKSYTIGQLYIKDAISLVGEDREGAYFCDTLEPSLHPTNHLRPKAIPGGRYDVAVTWSPRFKRWLQLLLKVPHRCGIRIHAGNNPEDSAGCILVGRALLPGHVYNSRSTLEKLMTLLKERKDGEAVHITIQ